MRLLFKVIPYVNWNFKALRRFGVSIYFRRTPSHCHSSTERHVQPVFFFSDKNFEGVPIVIIKQEAKDPCHCSHNDHDQSDTDRSSMILLDSAALAAQQQQQLYGTSPGSDYDESHFPPSINDSRLSPYPQAANSAFSQYSNQNMGYEVAQNESYPQRTTQNKYQLTMPTPEYGFQAIRAPNYQSGMSSPNFQTAPQSGFSSPNYGGSPQHHGGASPNYPSSPQHHGTASPNYRSSPLPPGTISPNYRSSPLPPGTISPNYRSSPLPPGMISPNYPPNQQSGFASPHYGGGSPQHPGTVSPNYPGSPLHHGGVSPNYPGSPLHHGGVSPNYQGSPLDHGGVSPNYQGSPLDHGGVSPNYQGSPLHPGTASPIYSSSPVYPSSPEGQFAEAQFTNMMPPQTQVPPAVSQLSPNTCCDDGNMLQCVTLGCSNVKLE